MKLSDKQISEILKSYNLGNFKSKSLIYDEWNTSYFIKTTTGNYLLKIINFQGEKEILAELNILQKLQDKIPTIFPIKTNNKKNFIFYKSKIILVFPFINGKPVLKGERLSSKLLIDLGKYYGIIHSTANLRNILQNDAYKEVQRFFNSIDKSSKEYKIAEKTFQLLRDHKFHQSNYPKGLIHADLHTENILVNKNKIVVILDFEEAHIDYFIYDFGIAILDTCWKNGSISKSRIRLFLKGYESVRNISSLEKRHLYDSVIFAGLYSLHWLVKKNKVNDKKNLDHYVVKRFLKLLKDSESKEMKLKVLN